MPWKRGTESVERELLRAQLWIENADPQLFGGNGSGKGIVRMFFDDKAAQEERDKEQARRDEKRNALLALLSVIGVFVGLALTGLGVLEANRQIREHTLTLPKISHSQPDSQNASNAPQHASRF